MSMPDAAPSKDIPDTSPSNTCNCPSIDHTKTHNKPPLPPPSTGCTQTPPCQSRTASSISNQQNVCTALNSDSTKIKTCDCCCKNSLSCHCSTTINSNSHNTNSSNTSATGRAISSSDSSIKNINTSNKGVSNSNKKSGNISITKAVGSSDRPPPPQCWDSANNTPRQQTMPPPPMSPSASSATDRDEEMAGFVQRMKMQQEQNGVCDATTNSESGTHHCPIIWRTRSLNAPSPIQQFGPCGRIMRNSAMVMTIQDPASQRLTWYKPPLSVLVIKKVRDAMVIPPFLELVTWLTEKNRMVVFVEASVLADHLVTSHAMFPAVKDKLMSFRETHDDLTDKIDFIICMGGDGTLLYASSLFQQSVPPVMAFHLGSLGFLTPFKFNNYQEQVTNVLEGHAALTLRSRLRCIILRRGQEKQLPPSQSHALDEQLDNDITKAYAKRAATQHSNSSDLKAPTNLLVLNEVVIDRGPSPYLSNLDLYLDGKRITSVQGDGLIVSTPTGSTAYAVAAGASMIHPSVPAIMVTPICPHSLSFRPIVVPAGVELKVKLNPAARNSCWVSFDGRHQMELMVGDSLRVTTSIYPVPSICAEDQIADWFASLDECLRWNDRKRQRHLDDVSPLDDTATPECPSTPTTPGPEEPPLDRELEEQVGGLHSVQETGDEEEEEEEEDQAPARE